MEYIPRKYQQQAIDDGIAYLESDSKDYSLIVIPTGGGKTIVLSSLANYTTQPLIVLQPSFTILRQNYSKYLSYGKEASIYSASAGSKEIGHVTFATPLSICKEVSYYKKYKPIIFLDEAHLSSKNNGIIGKFMKDIGVTKLVGLTATPLETRPDRNGWGSLAMINRSQKNIFKKIIHVTQIQELIAEGFWTPLVYSNRIVDVGALKLNSTGSDYTKKSIVQYYKDNELEEKVIEEVDTILKTRPNVLVFSPDIPSANKLASLIKGSRVVHSKLPKKEVERDIKEFVEGKYTTLINVQQLMVGFDFPALSSIIVTRPTRSLNIFYQVYGRGVRIFEGKKDVLVVDFTDNVDRFGRLEDLEFREVRGLWGLYSNSTNKKLTMGAEFAPPLPKLNLLSLQFGKYKGVEISKVPNTYLQALLEIYKPEEKILKEIERNFEKKLP